MWVGIPAHLWETLHQPWELTMPWSQPMWQFWIHHWLGSRPYVSAAWSQFCQSPPWSVDCFSTSTVPSELSKFSWLKDHPIPCNCFYINLIENWLMLTSLIIPASQSMLFDTKSTYLQKTERRVICSVLKVCCGSETRLSHFIFLRK